MAEVQNTSIKEDILSEIIGEDLAGGDINEVIRRKHLPFKISTPPLMDSVESPEA